LFVDVTALVIIAIDVAALFDFVLVVDVAVVAVTAFHVTAAAVVAVAAFAVVLCRCMSRTRTVRSSFQVSLLPLVVNFGKRCFQIFCFDYL